MTTTSRDNVPSDFVTNEGLQPIYLTCKEVANRWRCSKATIFRRIKNGLLDTIGESQLLRVTLESVLRYEAKTLNKRRFS